MRCVARLSITYTIYRTWKTTMEECSFAKSSTPPWVFFTFFKLYKWYQFAQRITYLLYRMVDLKIFAKTHESNVMESFFRNAGCLKSDSHFPKKLVLSASIGNIKNDEKNFYFTLGDLFVIKISRLFFQFFLSCRESVWQKCQD